jgi:hypothetical protein
VYLSDTESTFTITGREADMVYTAVARALALRVDVGKRGEYSDPSGAVFPSPIHFTGSSWKMLFMRIVIGSPWGQCPLLRLSWRRYDSVATAYLDMVTHCVYNATNLQDALNVASGNNAPDLIKVIQGRYNGNLTYYSSQGYNVTSVD